MSTTLLRARAKVSFKVRQIRDTDYEAIQNLVTPDHEKFFGTEDIILLIERCHSSYAILNNNDEVLGAICLDDHPNLLAILPSIWPKWLRRFYSIQGARSMNTLWIQYFVYDPDTFLSFQRPLFKCIFDLHSNLQQLLVITPGRTKHLSFLAVQFHVAMPHNLKFPKRVQTIYLTVREQYMKEHKVRGPVERDNDEIVTMIDNLDKRPKQMYGEFYISEMLTRNLLMERRIIVGQVIDDINGVIITNGDFSYEGLVETFNLEPFCLLRKFQIRKFKRYKPYQEAVEEDYRNAIGASTLSLTSQTSTSSSKSKVKAKSSNVSRSKDEGEEAGRTKSVDAKKSKASLLVNKYRRSFSTISAKKALNDQMQKHITNYMKSLVDMEVDNAFSIEVYTCKPESEPLLMEKMLQACFLEFPGRDYCVLRLPSRIENISLLNYFVRVVPRPLVSYHEELFVLHRNAVRPDFIVRRAAKNDMTALRIFCMFAYKKELVLEAIERAIDCEDDTIACFIMDQRRNILGFVIISLENDLEYYQYHFDMTAYYNPKNYKYDKAGRIDFALVSPLYHKHIPMFLREIHRMNDMSIIVHRMLLGEYARETRTKPFAGILSQMYRVFPRRTHYYPPDNGDEVQIPKILRRRGRLTCMMISTMRLLGLPRVEVNNRIVVVGASNTGLSFLETLIYEYDNINHVIYNNITLVTAQSLNYRSVKCSPKQFFFIYRGRYSNSYIDALGIRIHVSIVTGTMTCIRRRQKYIRVDKKYSIPYDLLILTTGEQHCYPTRRSPCGIPIPTKGKQKMYNNVFLINKQGEANHAIKEVRRLVRENRPGKIIIYGCTKHIYCCLATLQQIKTPMNKIVFVESYPKLGKSPPMRPFNDNFVDKQIVKILCSLDITYMSSYYFQDWTVDRRRKLVTKIRFVSNTKVKEIDCCALFFYETKRIPKETFLALVHSGLLFDGKLVIDANFHTNDPNIFAGGTMTKYCRRYYADRFEQKYYDSIEVGRTLARLIRNKILYSLSPNAADEVDVLPQFTDPKTTFCNLPNSMKYFKIQKAGIYFPPELAKQCANYGRNIITGLTYGTELTEIDYFNLYLNANNMVEKITCFTKRDIDVNNYMNLWGKHESLLNNLVLRYETGQIKNLYDYFREPWTCLIYYDRFETLHDRIFERFFSAKRPDGTLVMKRIIKVCMEHKWQRIPPDMMSEIVRVLKKLTSEEEVEKIVLNFIKENVTQLNMYAHPLVSQKFLQRYELSPLFYLYDVRDYDE